MVRSDKLKKHFVNSSRGVHSNPKSTKPFDTFGYRSRADTPIMKVTLKGASTKSKARITLAGMK
jgi:hypothetical protein